MNKIEVAPVKGYIQGLVAKCYIRNYGITNTGDYVQHSLKLRYGIKDNVFMSLVKEYVHYNYTELKLLDELERKGKHVKIDDWSKDEK